VDQAEPAREELSLYVNERRQDSALDRTLCVSGALVSEVTVETRDFVAAYVANIAA